MSFLKENHIVLEEYPGATMDPDIDDWLEAAVDMSKEKDLPVVFYAPSHGTYVAVLNYKPDQT